MNERQSLDYIVAVINKFLREQSKVKLTKEQVKTLSEAFKNIDTLIKEVEDAQESIKQIKDILESAVRKND